MDDTLLLEYALDLLDSAARAQVEHRLATDLAWQAELKALEQDLGLVALTAEPLVPSPQLRERILDAVAPKPRYDGMVNRLTAFLDLSVARVRALLDTANQLPREPWKQLLPGIYSLQFDGGPRRTEAHCSLLHIAAGAEFPAHRHRGEEWALLIDGYVQEADGRKYQAGDIVHKPVDSTHQVRAPVVPCLFAVVMHDGIAWLGD